MTPASVESDKLGPSSDQIESAPVMQLFDNYLVSRREDSSNNDQFTGAKDSSPKARAVRAELLSLLPPKEDILSIINWGLNFWCVWEGNPTELWAVVDSKSNNHDNAMAPAEIAKAVVCLSLSVMQSPPGFDFNTLQKPFDPQDFFTRSAGVVDRLVVRDDDFAATLPGIETQMLLSKFHMHEGRLRKAWLVNRRAIEFAHLAGMHLSTRMQRSTDALFERRLKIWCSLASLDRSLSLILGLPYEIADMFFLPQIENRLKLSNSTAEQYMLRIGVLTGHMIDRNQNPTEMCLATTLRLDQELMDAWKTMPQAFMGLEPGPGEQLEQFHERVPLQFMPKVLRALLHMPFMLKYPHDPRFSYCHHTAIQSAREGLTLFKVLRSITQSYLCKVLDFMAFMMGMLLIVHLHLVGFSEQVPEHSKEQDERDWQLVGEVVEILGQASEKSGSSVATESANILGEIFKSRNRQRSWATTATCRITVPYFGTITVGAGTKFSRPPNREQNPNAPIEPVPALTSTQTGSQLYTPPGSNPDGTSDLSGDTLNNTPEAGGSWSPSGQESAMNQFASVDTNAFTGLFDDFGQYMWPSDNVDLGLDQGWDLNWFE